ncbi:hypothetical protein NDU88_002723 [Pleurodeles waltl]|uniref:Secreted protein n=1 Tax=Pleurodeles waltl TaxID=8319 RepID=A0AAV7WPE1_PLEWA|nr:hypothetical protein NDU88_002723 [Pleurodeles waltl]
MVWPCWAWDLCTAWVLPPWERGPEAKSAELQRWRWHSGSPDERDGTGGKRSWGPIPPPPADRPSRTLQEVRQRARVLR